MWINIVRQKVPDNFRGQWHIVTLQTKLQVVVKYCLHYWSPRIRIFSYSHRGDTVFTGVCLSVCLSVCLFAQYRKNRCSENHQNVAYKCSTMSPGSPFILRSKGQMSRSRMTETLAAWFFALLWFMLLLYFDKCRNAERHGHRFSKHSTVNYEAPVSPLIAVAEALMWPRATESSLLLQQLVHGGVWLEIGFGKIMLGQAWILCHVRLLPTAAIPDGATFWPFFANMTHWTRLYADC